MNAQELREAVYGFPVWHYEFQLGDVTTPIFDHSHINRHAQRRKYFFDPLVQINGGSLQGKRVLDLGCNAGYWSLLAIQSGCEFVLGIDGRQMHIDQANLVFSEKRVDPRRYHFAAANVFSYDFSTLAPFDVVLCLGLLYHVSKPVELIEIASGVNTDLLLIDTDVTLARDARFNVRREPLTCPRNAIDYDVVLVPSRRAVIDITTLFGYTTTVIRPTMTDYTGAQDFKAGTRRAFLCSKHTDISEARADRTTPRLGSLQRQQFMRKAQRTRLELTQTAQRSAGALASGVTSRLRG